MALTAHKKWLIPAHAGKTIIHWSLFRSRWAHPRSRGENEPSCTDSLMTWGSSPLTRGKRVAPPAPTVGPGLIPAHAGKTAYPAHQPEPRGAHPRSRGENVLPARGWASHPGSSPLTRGKRFDLFPGRVDRGLIPAHAGKTIWPRSFFAAVRAHPRSRGENRACVHREQQAQGSSPLTRGKRPRANQRALRVRLIPAHAGKTRHIPCSRLQAGAHPRSRGENSYIPGGDTGVKGSSPLTRGKRARGRNHRPSTGLIPAHAGKTLSLLLARWWRRAHPRSRGENPQYRSVPGTLAGSSPLTRGKPVGDQFAGDDGGLIPAHAGKTFTYQV